MKTEVYFLQHTDPHKFRKQLIDAYKNGFTVKTHNSCLLQSDEESIVTNSVILEKKEEEGNEDRI